MNSRNNEGKIVIMLVVLLIAFALGSGIGITVGMSNDGIDSFINPEPVNKTIDVTNNISEYNPNFGKDFSYIEEDYSDEDLNVTPSEKSSGIYYSEEDLNNNTNNYDNTTIN